MGKKSTYTRRSGDVTKVRVNSDGTRRKYIKSKDGKITLLGPVLPSSKKTRSPSRAKIAGEVKTAVKRGKKNIRASKKK